MDNSNFTMPKISAGSFKFEKSVLTIATILLIVLLAAIGAMAYNSKFGQDFPPVQSECPDYWVVNADGTCTNKQNLGTCTDGSQHTMDFTTDEWSGVDGLKKKCKWAKECNITWDGVTNNDVACTSGTSSSMTDNGSSGGLTGFFKKIFG